MSQQGPDSFPMLFFLEKFYSTLPKLKTLSLSLCKPFHDSIH